jgi:hypothetical protein
LYKLYKNKWRYLLLTGLLLSGYFPSQAQWKLEKDENGIKIYTAESASSPVKSVKVEATLKGSCREFISVLKDIEKQPQWVYAARQAYLIKKISATELLYYVETALPWPARNRDAAVRMTIEEGAAGNKVNITTIGEPNAIPARSGKIRVPQFEGRWEAEAVNEGEIRIIYTLELNPGGSLPAGIVNLFVTKGPYETFINLSRLLQE